MQNSTQKFRQSSIVFEKPGILSEKLKTLTSSNYNRVYHFLLKLWTHFRLTNVCKRLFGIFFILFRSWGICQNKKITDFYILTETRFINNSRSEQNKESPDHPFADISKTEMCSKFQQEMVNSIVVGARQSLQFFRETIWFL